MFVSIDRLLWRLRDGARDDQGASLVVVVMMMAVGFIVSAVIASACLFTIQQTTKGRTNVQAFAAAEAGRDVVVASLAKDLDGCTNASYPEGTDPHYKVTVYSTDAATAPSSSAGLTASCPEASDTYVVIKSQGIVPNGSVTVESVYSIESYSDRVAGGGLGFIDQAYTTAGVTYDGDVIVRRGDFTCGGALGSPTRISGSVYVLNGSFNVPADILGNGADCEISGDVVASKSVSLGSCFTILITFCFGGDLDVGGRVKAATGITVRGALTAVGNINSGAGIETAKPAGSTIRSTNGSITAVGNISAANGAITAQAAIATSGSISASSTVSGGSISARTGISASGTTVEARSGALVSGGGITAATVTAVGDLTAAGAISATTVKSTGGAVKATGNITIASSGTLFAAGAIAAGGDIVGSSAEITAASISAVTKFSSSGRCTIAGDVLAGGQLSFSQSVVADSTSAVKCTIQGALRSYAANSVENILPQGGTQTAANTKRTQVWVKGAVQSRKWKSNGNYRDINVANANSNTKPPSATTPTGSAPATPSVPTAPTITYSVTDTGDTFRSLDELALRTQWIDLGTTTRWNGFPAKVVLSGSTNCTRSKITDILDDDADDVVIDATQCPSLSISGISKVELARNAVLLVNNISLTFVRFEASHLDPDELRQLFIVQVDDNLTERPPAKAPTAPPEPQPDCGSRGSIGISASGFTWDENVAVLLYSPCGSTSTTLLSRWVGHLYVARYDDKDSDQSINVFSNLECKRMVVENTLDLPCSVNKFGDWGGQHTEDFERIGDRLTQTEH